MIKLKPRPLTCRELKLMVGEPVWVVTAKRKEWCIVHSFNSVDVIGGGIIVTTRTSQKITLPYMDEWELWWAYKKAYDCPAIKFVPVVYGRWNVKYPMRECGCCGEIYTELGGNGGKAWNYCPNCGKPMDGGADG